MKRRDALKNTGLFVGIGLASGAISSAMFQSCKDAQNIASDVWKPEFIPTDLVEMVAEITETILPRTDTPGAKDVKVHHFLDAAWNLFYKPEEKAHIKKGLMAFDGECKSATGKSFMDLSAEERLAHLQSVEAEAKTKSGDEFWGIPEDEDGVEKEPVRQEPATSPVSLEPFWNYVKGNTLYAYFNSEEIGENVLTYDPVPGQAIGCMDMDPGMKIYSL